MKTADLGTPSGEAFAGLDGELVGRDADLSAADDDFSGRGTGRTDFMDRLAEERGPLGDFSSRLGDSPGRDAENPSRRGELSGQHGDSSGQHDDNSSRHGKLSGRRGDFSGRIAGNSAGFWARRRGFYSVDGTILTAMNKVSYLPETMEARAVWHANWIEQARVWEEWFCLEDWDFYW